MPLDPAPSDPRAFGGQTVPYLEQYFGAWAMETGRFLAGWEHLRRMNLSLHMEQVREQLRDEQVRAAGGDGGGRRSGYGYEITGTGIAIVDLAGTMMKQASSATASTSTVMLRQTIRGIASDSRVSGVLLRIDSPGGTVAGTQDLADDIAALAAKKPVAAYVEDLCASAAYWTACQCSEISAGRGSLVGSIGTYGVVADYSAAAAMEGVKVYVINAGDFKGAGTPGTEVTAEHRAEIKRTIDSLNAHFLQAVSSGRKLSAAKVAELADGRVHIADEAKSLGLVDHVENFDAALSRLEARASGRRPSNAAGGKATGPSAGDKTAAKGPLMPEASKKSDDTTTEDDNMKTKKAKSAEKEPEETPDDDMDSEDDKKDAKKAKKAKATAASISELKSAFPANAAFALDAAEKGLSLLEAKAAYADVLAAENAQLKATAAAHAREKESPAAPVKKAGVPALPTRAAGADAGEPRSAAEALEAAIKPYLAAGMTRDKAVMKINKTHAALIDAVRAEAQAARE